MNNILSFYLKLIGDIKERFNFSDPIFNLIDIMEPKVAQSFETQSLYPILERFPVLKKYVNLQDLDNEWRAHALLDFDSFGLQAYHDIEKYWSKIFSLKNEAGVDLFPNLKNTFSLLFVLPFSNASVERVFSDLFNIKTDKRNLLSTDTIRGLLATADGIKKNEGILNFTPTKDMLDANIWKKNID